MEYIISCGELEFIPISDRGALFKIYGQPTNINIIVSYAPISESTDQELLYDKLLIVFNDKECNVLVKESFGGSGLGLKNER